MFIEHLGNSYEHESSGPLMCVPACLNMILKRRNMSTYAQIDIACILGLVVPPSLLAQYDCAETSETEEDWGVHPQADGTSIKLFLKIKGVPLAYRYVDAREIPSDSTLDFLSDNLQHDNDIIVGYDYAATFKEGKNVGHVSLIRSIDSITETVELVDPEVTHTVSAPLRDLSKGVREKNDGFWIFAESLDRITHEYS